MAEFYQEFFASLRDPRSMSPGGLAPPLRFDVYRNNMHSSLVRALGEAYPAVQRLVGETFFQAMAAEFVRKELPASPLLLEYGESFPDFVDAFEPVAGLPYLGDVARLEWARQCAYHAEEAEPLDPQRLAAIEPLRLGALRFLVHPSLHICTSRFPVLDIWTTNARDAEVRGIDLDTGGQQVLIVRPHAQVTETRLQADDARFLRSIVDGRTLDESAQIAIADEAGFDLAASLQLLLQLGVLVDFRLPGCETIDTTDQAGRPRPTT